MEFLRAARHEYKEDRSVGAPLDRPMAHRLMELVMSTVPIYGHALLCSELILEHTHQIFKRWLLTNTHTDGHLTGMEKALARDWMWRLSSLYKIWTHGDGRTKAQAEVGLRRLLMGEDGMRVGPASRNGMAITAEMRAALQEAMRPPVTDLLEDCDDMNSSVSGSASYAWSAMWDDQAREFDPMCDKAIDKIVSHRDPNDIDVEDLHFFKRARYMQRDCSGPQRSYRYNVVEYDEAISAVVQDSTTNDDEFVTCVSDGNGIRKFYVVAGIIGNLRTDEVWVVCKEMIAEWQLYNCRNSSVKYVKLGVSCRRVAMVHSCSQHCIRKDGRAEPEHDRSPLQGGQYFMLGRADGFPPFQG